MDQKPLDLKFEKFSYSKLSTFESCGFQYKLKYLDKHFVDTSTIANEFGTLIHFIEETIAKDIVANNHEPYFMIDSEKYKKIFLEGFHSNSETILGISELKEKYPQDFYLADKSGLTYQQKTKIYLDNGIYRLQKFLSEHPELHIIGTEIPFDVEYNNYIFHGFIDRLLQNIYTGELIIEDIKTWTRIDNHDLKTPLQFVFYSRAVEEMYPGFKISCRYDLPLLDERVDAGSKGFLARGYNKINKLLAKIEAAEFIPNPSPLCHWCVYSATYPNQPEDAKNLCPYFCHYTKETPKDFSVEYEWMGIENHEAIMHQFLQKEMAKQALQKQLPNLSMTSTVEDRSFKWRYRQ